MKTFTISVASGVLLLCVAAVAQPDPVAPRPPLAVHDAARPQVEPFDLADVKLLDSPFLQAMERNRRYLLSLDPDRFLHNFRKNAGLPPRAPIYGGWESQGVAGQTLGHYLSALAMQYRATGDTRFKARVDYIVDELSLCQEKNGNGYVSAIPDGKAMFADVAVGKGNGVHRGWVPWYTMHKLFAGLRDAHLYAGSQRAKVVLVKLSDWAIDTTQNLSDEQWQIMLTQEHGGMNETLADVYALTGNRKYLDLAGKFYHRSVLDPLTRREDRLAGLHGNTQIPKLIGLARIHELTGDAKARTAAEFFWDRVVHTRSYVIGGNTEHEHFGPPGDLGKRLGPSTAETCNTYNMLKMTRHLFSWTADAQYADYYERALYNHILASQEPRRGMFTYFMSLKPGHFKTYSEPFDAMWCCVGTGIENHVKYGDSIYFHNGDTVYVNLFIPSELTWREKGLTLRQETRFPEADTTRLTFTCATPVQAALKVRYPTWSRGLSVSVNGRPHKIDARPGGYVTVSRRWTSGDRVEVRLPMRLSEEAMPDNPSRVAFLYGPIVLAGQLGSEGLAAPIPYATSQNAYFNVPAPSVPALVSRSGSLTARVRPVSGEPLTFRTVGLAQPGDVTLRPFYSTYYGRYTVYWDRFTPERWTAIQTEYRAEQERLRILQARTVDQVRIGEQQPEVDHNLQHERSRAGEGVQGRRWRDATDGGWFSYDLMVLPDAPQDLICTYWGDDDGNRVFDILVDGRVIATQTLTRKPDTAGRYYDVLYPLPQEGVTGKSKVTVRFQAKPGNLVGGVFDCRIVRRR